MYIDVQSIGKYDACQEMLAEILAQYVAPRPTIFGGPPQDPRQAALYAAACGLAKAAIGFAVTSEGHDYDDAVVLHQAEDPRWVAAQSRQTLADLFKKHEDDEEAYDDGR